MVMFTVYIFHEIRIFTDIALGCTSALKSLQLCLYLVHHMWFVISISTVIVSH